MIFFQVFQPKMVGVKQPIEEQISIEIESQGYCILNEKIKTDLFTIQEIIADVNLEIDNEGEDPSNFESKSRFVNYVTYGNWQKYLKVPEKPKTWTCGAWEYNESKKIYESCGLANLYLYTLKIKNIEEGSIYFYESDLATFKIESGKIHVYKYDCFGKKTLFGKEERKFITVHGIPFYFRHPESLEKIDLNKISLIKNHNLSSNLQKITFPYFDKKQ